MKVVHIRETERTPRGERRIAQYLSESKLEGTAFWGYPYWYFDQKSQRRVRREIDFLVVVQKQGLLVVEVKDGSVQVQVALNKGIARTNWTSIDFRGARHTIKAPDDQAEDGKWSVIPLLKKFGCPPTPAGIGVCLPDTEALSASWIPPEILALKEDMLSQTAFESFLLRCSKFCLPTPSWTDDSYHLTCEALLPTTAEKTSFRVELESTERQIAEASESVVSLVQDQIDALSYLYGRSRGLVTGSAGTGKTLVAINLAKSLALNGLRVLVLVPTTPLKNAIAESLSRQGVSTFIASSHNYLANAVELFELWEGAVVADPQSLTRLLFELQQKSRKTFKDQDNLREAVGDFKKNLSLRDKKLQDGVARNRAAEISVLPGRGEFDAIIVDETQDIPGVFIQQAMRFLNHPSDSPAYFFVDFQQIRDKWVDSVGLIPLPWDGIIPRDSQIVSLGTNCRNPRSIGDELVRLKGPVRFHPLSPRGQDVRWVLYKGIPDAEQMGVIVKSLMLDLNRDGVFKKERMVVHAPTTFPPSEYSAYKKAIKTKYGPFNGFYKIDTIKGLEAPVVVVVIGPLDEINEVLVSQLYIAFSRATSFLVVCCSSDFQSRLDEYLRNHES